MEIDGKGAQQTAVSVSGSHPRPQPLINLDNDEDDLNEQGGSSIALPPEVQKGGGPIFSEILRRRADIHHQPTHKQLKQDLIEHIWQKFPNRRNN